MGGSGGAPAADAKVADRPLPRHGSSRAGTSRPACLSAAWDGGVSDQDEAEQFKDPSLLNPYETFRGRSGTSNMTTRNSQRQQESEA